jgi:hypothetical protein
MATSGILCTLPSDPELDGVFPQLSPTRLSAAQEIRFYRGDSFRIGVQLQDDRDPPSGVSLVGALIRFSAKQGFGKYVQPQIIGNDAAMVRKTSRDENQIKVVDEANGRFLIFIDQTDTYDHPVVQAVWDIEITIPDPERPSVDIDVTVQSGVDVLMPFSPADAFPTWVARGHLVSVQGKTAMVVRRIDDRHVQVDSTDWTTEAQTCATLSRTYTRTVAAGPWICAPDVSL